MKGAMERNQRWVNLTYLAICTAVSAVLFMLATYFVQKFDLEARFRDIDWFTRGGVLAVAGLGYLALSRSRVSNVFFSEVFAELENVSWPSQRDTSASTVVVLVMVLVAGVVLGGLDTFWVWVFRGIF